ncbi:hypothetical protein [Nostoc sp.]|uniref:hypothetical protein n=1 Tax=Nostoc sp. TaxID=1180 RepID=UPI002FF976D5
MSDILNHIEENPKETKRLIGMGYEQLQQLIYNAEQLHDEQQALLELLLAVEVVNQSYLSKNK